MYVSKRNIRKELSLYCARNREFSALIMFQMFHDMNHMHIVKLMVGDA